ncbi:alpha/beta fold hydrolase, partial [Streptomyces sp. NPDC048845]|uniref:alpha/beta fold hydrolase n=1 Tax=Streptomyces sp. NPDC048845 TaxID=3155390 RepID=UPI003433B8F2
MPTFLSTDGTRLAHHSTGSGDPLIVLPGGPMRASAYLGDLGGLAAHRTLHLLDLRGTGASEVPADPGSYRCDRQVGDLEAFRGQLGLERLDILAHSAGANLALLYAARHPERIRGLTLVAPGLAALGFQATEASLREAAELRSGQPWFAEAKAAFEEILAGRVTEENRQAVMPFFFGRWDAAARAVAEASPAQRNQEAAAVFDAEGAYGGVGPGVPGRGAPARAGRRGDRGGPHDQRRH